MNSRDNSTILTMKKVRNHSTQAIISFILSIINLLVWSTTLLPGSNGSSGLYLGVYYMSWVGFAVNIITIILGIFGLKSSRKGLAIASLILTLAPFLLLIIVIPFTLKRG